MLERYRKYKCCVFIDFKYKLLGKLRESMSSDFTDNMCLNFQIHNLNEISLLSLA